MHVSETQCLETAWVTHAAALYTATLSLCALYCQKGKQSEKENIAKKGYGAVSRKYVKKETKTLKPTPLLELRSWSEHQLLTITPQSVSSPAATVWHAQKEKKQ